MILERVDAVYFVKEKGCDVSDWLTKVFMSVLLVTGKALRQG